jgi:hypothetical protein
METTTIVTANPWLSPRPNGSGGTPAGSPILSVGTMNFGKRTTPEESERIVKR